jgi:hypothetical protein
VLGVATIVLWLPVADATRPAGPGHPPWPQASFPFENISKNANSGKRNFEIFAVFSEVFSTADRAFTGAFSMGSCSVKLQVKNTRVQPKMRSSDIHF